MKIHMPDQSHIPMLRALWKASFGDTDSFLDTFFQTAFSTERCRIVTINKKLVASLYWFNCSYNNKQVAYIYAISTTPDYRGQGICKQLMRDTHLHLKANGYYGAILVPADNELFNFYAKIGYKYCIEIDEFNLVNSKTSPQANITAQIVHDNFIIYKITKEEYARRRRQLLPKGGVIQENENLDFLETQAHFYRGNDFLLTASVENDTLYGFELLGNTSVAEAVINALGCSKGVFRTVGNQKTFAMYLSLTDDTLNSDDYPSYFAFAFD